MLQNLFSISQFQLTKWSFLVHRTTRIAPYIQPSHDSIIELLLTFPNEEMGSSHSTQTQNLFILSKSLRQYEELQNTKKQKAVGM